MSVVPRFDRLFGADGRCLEVAMDHGLHNEPSFLPGIEDLKRAKHNGIARVQSSRTT